MVKPIKLCSFTGCERKVHCRSLCGGHYQQWKRDPLALTPLTRRGITTGMTTQERFEHYVTERGSCFIWTGTINAYGYGTFGAGARDHMAHRFAFEMYMHEIPDGAQLDHMCHNRACVNVEHLRVVTNKQNNENPSGLNSNNKSGYRGVSWFARDSKWSAQVMHNGTTRHLGYFEDVHEAGAVALAKRLELHTHSDGR